MPSMHIVFEQILVILLYVLIGFAAGKVGLIRPDQRIYLTRICTDNRSERRRFEEEELL